MQSDQVVGIMYVVTIYLLWNIPVLVIMSMLSCGINEVMRMIATIGDVIDTSVHCNYLWNAITEFEECFPLSIIDLFKDVLLLSIGHVNQRFLSLVEREQVNARYGIAVLELCLHYPRQFIGGMIDDGAVLVLHLIRDEEISHIIDDAAWSVVTWVGFIRRFIVPYVPASACELIGVERDGYAHIASIECLLDCFLIRDGIRQLYLAESLRR